MRQKRRIFEVNGIVQGVGFRPFAYRLASSLGLRGFVRNETSCVRIDVEGDEGALETFAARLISDAPPLARISGISAEDANPAGAAGFAVENSSGEGGGAPAVPPDAATCDECLRELRDPGDRRFGYPFINCTDCGPRYTIIKGVPYDRPLTTMSAFGMCDRCSREYHDPADRRFHAQPNACPDCGPKVFLAGGDGLEKASPDPVSEAAGALARGLVVAVKGIGGFHLACDAESEEAVGRLRLRKRREEKPFALMARDMAAVRRVAEASEAEERLVSSPARPIVLLAKKPRSRLAGLIAPGNRFLGVMLPYSPLHHLLLARGPEILVMTSGNMSDEPIEFANADALERLRGIADLFLLNDRDIETPADDSIARIAAGRAVLSRRSRGYVPSPVRMPFEGPSVLAVGADLKNTVCVTRGGHAFLSHHLGDLENQRALEAFETASRRLARLVGAEAGVVAHDMHPGYASTRFALSLEGVENIAVQHHHAHVASVMAENGLDGEVLGVALDGTGYGPDGTVWGGEFLAAGYGGFRRVARLRQVRMPGADAAARQGWRMAMSHVIDALGPGGLAAAPRLAPDSRSESVVAAMIGRGFNAPLTSSMGRLFDAAAAICGVASVSTFEGQAAMALEGAADGPAGDPYPFAIMEEAGLLVADTRPAVAAMVDDVAKGAAVPAVSRRFHGTAAAIVVRTCEMLGKRLGLDRVALSGGCFQNAILLEACVAGLSKAGFAVYTHCLVPPNDGGVSLGQAAVAAASALEAGKGR